MCVFVLIKLYTSYFGNYRNLYDTLCVSIARKPPNGWTGETCTALAPSWEILSAYKNDHDEEKYTKAFETYLYSNSVDAEFIIKRLQQLALHYGVSSITFLCYETPEKFCHRHLVAKWLRQYGYDVTEWRN